MARKIALLLCVILMLAFSAGSALAELDLKVDIGCPGQEAAGNLKEGWVAFDGTACSGAVGPVTVTNIGGSGIDVGITVGNTSDNAYRSPGEYTGDEMGRDYVSADNSISQAECTMTMTLKNLPEAQYTLTTYHNCPDYYATMATMDITVSGSGAVGTPTNASGVAQTVLSQNVAFDEIGKGTVEFVANGVGEVVVTFVPREQAHKWRVYLNGFELIGADLRPTIRFDSAASGNLEPVSPAELMVTLSWPEEGQTYTVDYAATGGTATAGEDYTMSGGTGPACWNYATQCHGDCDNDANVKGSDFLALKNSWYQCDPDANYNPCADFDRDGCVKGSDFLILKSNWYQTVEANCPSSGGGSTLVFNPGETSRTISIDIIDDGLDEEDETIIVELLNPTGPDVVLGEPNRHTYTIIETIPSVEFESSGSSGGESETPAYIAVSLSHVWSETVTVQYAVTGGSATDGTDYTLNPGTLTFTAGQTSKTISISVVDDDTEEEDETIVVGLSSPSNATLGTKTEHTYTIIDNEAGMVWDGLTWFYSESYSRISVNPEGDLEWQPEQGGQFITRLPTQRFSEPGDKVEIIYWWMTDGKHDCPDGSCLICEGRCSDDIRCISGTSDMRGGLYEADGEYVEQEGLGVHNSIFVGYKGYNFRFGPNMDEDIPTRWVDCWDEVHKTGNICKKPESEDNLMTYNRGEMAYLPGFNLAPGEWSLWTISLERLSSSSVHLSITLNGRTYTDVDSNGSEQPSKIDVFAIHMRNGRPYSRLVLAKP